MTASALPKTLPLKAANGKTIDIPTIGYGTWASGDTSWAKDSTLTALKEGYRHIDGAWYYGVTKPVGEAIRESGVPREEIFWTSKAWMHFFSPSNIELALDKILADAGLSHVDLFLAHWPAAQQPISRASLEKASVRPGATSEEKGQATDSTGKTLVDWEHTSAPIAAKAGKQGSFVPTWKAMQDLVRKGKARAIGVSNFSQADLEDLLNSPDIDHSIPISCNQIEVHPWLPQNELIAFHNKHGIITTCFSPFAGQKSDGKTLLNDPDVVALAKKNGMDVGQLLQSWAVQRGAIPLGKSATPSRIKSNIRIGRLSAKDFETLNGMGLPNGEGRTVNPSEAFGVELF
ncbi:Putative aldo/keto reductase, aldo-keto reductase, NADP-dependent oxidoreductase [Septoria linicola]|uniref:Aldo/keto reductase, aldo-keto reductase, NADP-dependent oxidoreductase n=1 Tax=Septoria linicola TaxID=215465 RepID=A0A9Q9B6X8_9PEZI|nr:Putative aldo/keto reductase, aldo-keto reductase, NADP-dependent oxidoreductase [Septoria linicola]